MNGSTDSFAMYKHTYHGTPPKGEAMAYAIHPDHIRAENSGYFTQNLTNATAIDKEGIVQSKRPLDFRRDADLREAALKRAWCLR